MARLRRFFLRLFTFFRPERADRELTREVGSHLGLLEDEFQRRGMPPTEARLAARRAFGGVEQAKERSRDERSFLWLEDARRDSRHAARTLARAPGFTAVAILTLALGVGSNTLLFSVVNAVLLRPLPYAEPDELVSVGSRWTGFDHSSVSLPEYFDYRAQATTFSDLAAYRTRSVNLTTGPGDAERIGSAEVTASLFQVVGVRAVHGRVIRSDENLRGGNCTAVLGHGLWLRKFGGDPEVIGDMLRVHGEPCSVIGVMPRGFYFPNQETEMWLPLVADPRSPDGRGAHNRQVVGRLAEGSSLTQARAAMNTIADRLQEGYPNNYPEGSGWGISLRALHEHRVGPSRRALLVLLGAVVLVQLITWVNVANLLLARGEARRRELAIRAALGASGLRLLRQLLTESAVLAALGGTAGVLAAWWGIDLVASAQLESLPRSSDATLDGSVLVYALGAASLGVLVFGLIPALQSVRDPDHSINADAGSVRTGRRSLRPMLIVAEVALAMVLLVSASLMIRSFAELLDVDPGFETKNVATARLSVARARHPEDYQVTQLYQEVLDRLRSTPDVTAAGAVSILPLSGSDTDFTFGIEGYRPPAPGLGPDEQARIVTDGYFEALGIPLRDGRLFQRSDTADAPRVVVVSESLARKYSSDVDPIGRRIKLWSLDEDGPWWTIVGVVGDVRHFGLDADAHPIIYWPHSQFVEETLTVVVRTTSDPRAMLETIRAAVRNVDPEQPVYDLETMEQKVADSLGRRRFTLITLGLFAIGALALAAIGLYGVLSYAVTHRKRELGVRIALGATRGTVLRLVLGEGALLVFAGLTLGTAAALLLTRVLGSLLFGVTPTDPVTFVSTALLLLAVGILACYVPARRAVRIDVTEAIRHE